MCQSVRLEWHPSPEVWPALTWSAGLAAGRRQGGRPLRTVQPPGSLLGTLLWGPTRTDRRFSLPRIR